MNVSAKPAGSEVIHFWPAFLFEDFDENIESQAARPDPAGVADQQIPEIVIDTLIEALRWAPSAGNLQSRKFYFVFNEDIRNKLAQSGLKHDFVSFIARAPLVVVVCADLRISSRYGERGKHLYCIQDTAASVQNLLLTAHELGLWICWVGAFKEEKVREVLNLPENLRPVAIIPVGYPARTPKVPARAFKVEAVELVP